MPLWSPHFFRFFFVVVVLLPVVVAVVVVVVVADVDDRFFRGIVFSLLSGVNAFFIPFFFFFFSFSFSFSFFYITSFRLLCVDFVDSSISFSWHKKQTTSFTFRLHSGSLLLISCFSSLNRRKLLGVLFPVVIFASPFALSVNFFADVLLAD